MLDNPEYSVRDAIFSVAPMRKGFLLRTHHWAYIQYKEDGSGGIELFDTRKDPGQFTNLALNPEYYKSIVDTFKARMAGKLKAVRDNI